jgi:hypothetical protein
MLGPLTGLMPLLSNGGMEMSRMAFAKGLWWDLRGSAGGNSLLHDMNPERSKYVQTHKPLDRE